MAEFSWAYIDSEAVVTVAGPTGSVQYRVADADGHTVMSGSTSLMFHTASNQLELGGSLSASSNISASAFYGDGSNLTGISPTPAGSNTEIQFNNAGAFGASANLTWDGSALDVVGTAMITGSLELTGSTQSLITLHTRDADSLKEIAFLKDGSPAAAIQINSAEHLFIENENAKDIILRASNLNTLRVIGSQRRVIVGAVSKITANAELDVEGSAIVSGTLTTTDDISVPDDTKLNLGDSADALIEFDSGVGRLAVSGSAIGIDIKGGSIGIDYPGGTVVSGTLAGAGSYLGLNSSHQIILTSSAGGGADPFPYTGDAQITGSLLINSGSTQVFRIDSSDAGLGRMLAKQTHVIYSNFNYGGSLLRYIPLNAPEVEGASPDTPQVIIKPFGGRLVKLIHAQSNTPGAGAELRMSFYTGSAGQFPATYVGAEAVGQITASLPAPRTPVILDTTTSVNRTGSFSFDAGSTVAISFDIDSSGGDIFVTTVWEYDLFDEIV